MSIKRIHKESGKTMKEVSEDLNIPFSTFNNYILGYREPNFETLIKIADYYHVSVDNLLDHKTMSINLDDLSLIKRDCLRELISLDDMKCAKILSFIEFVKNEDKNR